MLVFFSGGILAKVHKASPAGDGGALSRPLWAMASALKRELPNMESKPTLKDLSQTPRCRAYAGGSLLTVPSRLAGGASTASLREKRVNRRLTIGARHIAPNESWYPEAIPSTNIPARLNRKKFKGGRLEFQRPGFGLSVECPYGSRSRSVPARSRVRLLLTQGVMS